LLLLPCPYHTFPLFISYFAGAYERLGAVMGSFLSEKNENHWLSSSFSFCLIALKEKAALAALIG